MPYHTITTEVDVDVDLSYFDHGQLADEIRHRIKREKGKGQKELMQEFITAIRGEDDGQASGHISLLDSMKMELAKKIADRSTLQELEELYRRQPR